MFCSPRMVIVAFYRFCGVRFRYPEIYHATFIDNAQKSCCISLIAFNDSINSKILTKMGKPVR